MSSRPRKFGPRKFDPRKFCLIIAALLPSVTIARAEVEIRPLALSVGSAAIEQMDFEFRPGGINAGVGVHVLITGLDTPIVDIDDDASTLDKATDSTGRDLLAEPPRSDTGMSMSRAGIGPFPSVSPDGKSAIVELTAPQPPAKGATSLRFEGTLGVVVASGSKTQSANAVALEPGKFKIAEHEFQITAVAAHDWEEGKFKLTIRTTKAALDSIASWSITDPDGAVIADGPYSTMTMMDTAEVELTLESKPATINVELEQYEGMKRIEVPLTVDVGLGIE